jgi:hypothetical protein
MFEVWGVLEISAHFKNGVRGCLFWEWIVLCKTLCKTQGHKIKINCHLLVTPRGYHGMKKEGKLDGAFQKLKCPMK